MPNTRVQQKPPMVSKGKIAGVDTKWWLIGGGVAAFFVYRSYRKASQAAAQSQVDPTQGGTIDPNTGLPYADEYANLTGYGGGGGFLPYGGSSYGAIDPLTGVPYALEAMQSVTPLPSSLTAGVPVDPSSEPTPLPVAPQPISGYNPNRLPGGIRYFPAPNPILETSAVEAQPITTSYGSQFFNSGGLR